MDFFTHILMGILVPIPLLGHVPPETILFIWIMSFLPDLDIILEPLQKKRNSYMLSHKAASHSIIVGLVFTGGISLILNLIFPKISFISTWLGGSIGYSIHTFLDFFTASKIPIFYPISKKEYRFLADRAVNPLLASFSIVNILIFITLFIFGANISVYNILFYVFFSCYMGYFGFKAFIKSHIQHKLPKNHLYIPGIIPIFYMIYEIQEEKYEINYRLVKRKLLSSKSIELIQKSYLINSIEMDFFNKAIEYSKKYRFFYKWNAIIPLFKVEDEFIKVKIILAEAYSRNISYTFTIIFNKKTKEVIKKEEGFISLEEWINM
ncbi:MAG: metal-dependent hydrolase [Candidatus Lokiarchaeota archaeon]|nr:metal-dependent hydrolase [Candidatus Lokiarchaeota archaeon]